LKGRSRLALPHAPRCELVGPAFPSPAAAYHHPKLSARWSPYSLQHAAGAALARCPRRRQRPFSGSLKPAVAPPTTSPP
jgi:hypothetical protein